MHQLSLLEYARLLAPGLNDREHIEAIAAGTIRELDEKPPIDLDVVASYRGVSEVRVRPLPVAGMLLPSDGRLVIAVREDDTPRRRRFTGFHEVGHTFQPGYRESIQFRCAHPSATPRGELDPEALSDAAAAEMLLPADFFVKDLRASDFGVRTVMQLADAYEASIQATAYRTVRFWPESVLMVILEPGLRKAEREDPLAIPRLRVRSAYGSGRWPYIPPNKSAADNGHLVRVLSGEKVDGPATLTELGIASDEVLHLSARKLEYSSPQGKQQRVLALYRRNVKPSG